MAQLARQPFSRGEYRNRLHETQRRMKDRGLDVLLITDPGNMFYLSGYDAYSFYVPQILLVTPDREQSVWVGRDQDYTCATETTWLDTDNIVVYSDEYVDSDKHPMSFAGDILDDWGQADTTIGVEMKSDHFSAHAYHGFKQAPAVDRLMADLVSFGASDLVDVEYFSLSRSTDLVSLYGGCIWVLNRT